MGKNPKKDSFFYKIIRKAWYNNTQSALLAEFAIHFVYTHKHSSTYKKMVAQKVLKKKRKGFTITCKAYLRSG